MTFKVGDKVLVVSCSDMEDLVGRTATVAFARDSDDESILIQVEGRTDLHSGVSPGGPLNKWWMAPDELQAVPATTAVRAPSIADDLRLFPQDRIVLRHLKQGKEITPMKAIVVYGLTRLAAQIYNIRKAGYNVTNTMRTDESGKHYSVYRLLAN